MLQIIGGIGLDGKSGAAASWPILATGGVGNKTGKLVNYNAGTVVEYTNNGTGGLLIIYTNTIENNGVIESNGVDSSYVTSTRTNGSTATGGASGGGSINVFYKSLIKKGTIEANGGLGKACEGFQDNHKGGSGGNGSISIGNVSSGTYVDYTEN